MAPMGYSGAWEKLIHEVEISCQAPFKYVKVS
jgi:hypothetical protein